MKDKKRERGGEEHTSNDPPTGSSSQGPLRDPDEFLTFELDAGEQTARPLLKDGVSTETVRRQRKWESRWDIFSGELVTSGLNHE